MQVRKPKLISGKINYKATASTCHSVEKEKKWTQQDDFNVKLNQTKNETVLQDRNQNILDNKGQPAKVFNVKDKSWVNAYGAGLTNGLPRDLSFPEGPNGLGGACVDMEIMDKYNPRR